MLVTGLPVTAEGMSILSELSTETLVRKIFQSDDW